MRGGTILVAVLCTFVLSVSATYVAVKASDEGPQKNESASIPKLVTVDQGLQDCCGISIFRKNDDQHRLIKPILFVDETGESSLLEPAKKKFEAAIAELKKEGLITRASVYFKDLNATHWVGVGAEELYYPGSLLKVAMLLHILKKSESNAQLLSSPVQLNGLNSVPVVVAPSRRLMPGKSYTVKELLEFMIIRSDNDALAVMSAFADENFYRELFSDLGIPVPDNEDLYYQISAVNYARFFRVLYNATYLNEENSQYALNLLAQSEFKDGMKASCPPGAVLAHKFGERFTEGDNKQFHETGIIYFQGRAILMSIMTEGSEFPELMQAVREITRAGVDSWQKVAR